MEKPLGHYFNVWSPYYQATQCKSDSVLTNPIEKDGEQGWLMKENFMAPFLNGWGSTASKLQSHWKETVYFLPLKFPEIPGTDLTDLIWFEGCKTELNLEPPSGFEQGTPGLGIQHLNH